MWHKYLLLSNERNIFYIKNIIVKIIKITSCFAAALLIISCNDTATEKTTTNLDTTNNMDNSRTDNTMNDQNTTTPMSTSSPEQDALNYLVPKNAGEIAFLNAGISNGKMKDIKDHSRMMLADHKKLSEEVGKYIKAHSNINMPNIDTTNAVNINASPGNEWDKAWTEKLISDHEEILGKLNDAEKNVTDAEFKKMVMSTKKTVEHHLEMGKMIQKKMK